MDARWFVIVAISILIGGCASTVEVEIDAPVTIPDEFSQSGDDSLPAKWWLHFNDAVLGDLIDRSLAQNLTLRSAWDRLAQAEALAKQQNAPLLPSINAETDLLRDEISSSDADQTSWILGLAASYELDLWGRIRSSRNASEWDVRASEQDIHATAVTLSAVIATIWYQLVEQYGQIDLLNRQLQTNEQILELVTLRFRRGQINASDVLQQRQLLESIRGDINLAQSQASILEHQLSILTGQPPNIPVSKRIAELIELPALPETGLPSELIEQRPDIRSAYYRVLAADSRISAAMADRFPRLSLSVSGRTASGRFSQLFDSWITSVLANLFAPVIDGGQRRAEIERSRAVLSERLHDYGQTILDSLVEVEDALLQEQHQRELIDSLEKQLHLSNQVIQRIRDSYVKGAVDYLRVLDALLTEQSLERRFLQAQRQMIEFRIDLCRALGGTWPMQRPELASLGGSE